MENSTKTVLITGGSRGIGRAIALKLAEQYDQVAFFYAGNEQAARDTEALLQEKGVKALGLKCDVSDSAAVEQALNRVREVFGPVNALINNAGITRDGLSLRMKDEDFDRVIAVNLSGAFHLIRACYRDLMRQKGGRIVNISSVSGLMGNPGQVNYASAKAGLIGLTKTIARELAPRGVTCNAVAPGFIDTDMTQAMNQDTLNAVVARVPAARIGTAEDIASAVAFLCSPGADYVTGTVLKVDGGLYM